MKTKYSFDDIALLPGYADRAPSDVYVGTQLTSEIRLSIPLMSAAMDKVTEHQMAIAMAAAGGIGIIHRNMSPKEQAKEVYKVKRREGGIVKNPTTLYADQFIHEGLALAKNCGFRSFPVLGRDATFIGMVTARDFRLCAEADQVISDIMTPISDLRYTTVEELDTGFDAAAAMRESKVERLPIVEEDDGDLYCVGMVTLKDINLYNESPDASRDSNGRLLVGAAVGVGEDELQRTETLVREGVDVIVVDTAHGFSKPVLMQIMAIKDEWPDLQVIGGNVCTVEGALGLQRAGADAVKIGMGPGSICTTRIITGVGVPQYSAVKDITDVILVPAICDGGIRYSGDLVKAIQAGANAAMIGNLFAGTAETPGEIFMMDGRPWKSYRGMGSLGAMSVRESSRDRYGQRGVEESKLIPEGIEGKVPFKGSVEDIIIQLVGGLRAGLGYCGAANIAEHQAKTQAVLVTNSALRESHVHEVSITKESPNYSQ